MKILILLFLSFIFFNGCESYKKHSYLGELPYIADKFYIEIDKLHQDLLKTTDAEKGSKILNQIAAFKKEADEELKDHFSSLDFPINIPFSQDIQKEFFDIQSIEVEQIRFNEIEIKAVITAVVDSKNPVFTYLRFTDEQGKELPGWILLLSPFDVIKDKVYTATGTYKGLHHLHNADRLVVKSAEDFDNNITFNP